jgi:hypothetical protein
VRGAVCTVGEVDSSHPRPMDCESLRNTSVTLGDAVENATEQRGLVPALLDVPHRLPCSCAPSVPRGSSQLRRKARGSRFETPHIRRGGRSTWSVEAQSPVAHRAILHTSSRWSMSKLDPDRISR